MLLFNFISFLKAKRDAFQCLSDQNEPRNSQLPFLSFDQLSNSFTYRKNRHLLYCIIKNDVAFKRFGSRGGNLYWRMTRDAFSIAFLPIVREIHTSSSSKCTLVPSTVWHRAKARVQEVMSACVPVRDISDIPTKPFPRQTNRTFPMCAYTHSHV